jgi:hypothetical protein
VTSSRVFGGNSLIRVVSRAIRKGWEAFWYPRTEAFDLGFARFLFFGWVFYRTWRRDFLPWGGLPEELFYPMPFMKLVGYPIVSAQTLEILQTLWRVSLVLGCVGLLTRISAFIGGILTGYLWTLTYGYTHEAHGSIALIFTMFVLAAARSGDAFSVDSLLFRSRNRIGASPEYGWPMRLISCIYVLMFFASAVAKIVNTGFTWGLQAMTNILAEYRLWANVSQIRLIDFMLNNLPMHWVGTGALLLELAAPLALFGGVVRVVILSSLITMQLLIFHTMGLDFRPTFGLIPFFVPWTSLRRALFAKAKRVFSR